jgi:hypothetical protein
MWEENLMYQLIWGPMFVELPGKCPAYPYLKTALHVHADSDDTTQHNIIEN